jgi:hypothetical protein
MNEYEQEFVIQACREVGGVFEEGFLGDIIDTGGEDLYQVVAEHGASRCRVQRKFYFTASPIDYGATCSDEL